MDGRGRLAQPLKRNEDARARSGRAVRSRIRSTRFGRLLHRFTGPLLDWQPPRGVGVSAATVLIIASGFYGAVKGDHLQTLAAQWHDLCDSGANALGFRIAQVTLSGARQIDHQRLFAQAGLTPTSSLPFLDLSDARDRLQANPWIAEATLRKFYPGRLEIDIKERDAFALWQHQGKIFVIAADGTKLQDYNDARFAGLPQLVGAGAETRGRDFLTQLAGYPKIVQKLRAAVLIAQRRWNLRLKNGIDVRLPENNVEAALAMLASLDRDQQLLSRDIVAVDLRLADRVTVRLSEAAAQARADALKDKSKKARKGSDA